MFTLANSTTTLAQEGLNGGQSQAAGEVAQSALTQAQQQSQLLNPTK